MTDDSDLAYSDMMRGLLSGTPLGRLGTPDEVAGVVEFVASPGAAFVTGSEVVVDGGFLAQQSTA